MKLRKALILILAVVALTALALGLSACSSSLDLDGLTPVVYELEGGTYNNSKKPVKQYYNLKEGQTVHIQDPPTLSGARFERPGYTLQGWYRTKNEDGTYSDKWDFKNDVLKSGEGITLYAYWEQDLVFYYAICYVDENGTEHELGRYEVSAGYRFNDINNYGDTREGYTRVGYKDADGNPWNSDFKHPGGANGAVVKVYGEYMEGEYKLVGTPGELKAANGYNVYLTDDIDFDGDKFPSWAVPGRSYGHIFKGNGHTVSNFTLTHLPTLVDDNEFGNKALFISLFGNLDGATISEVAFEGATIEIDARIERLERVFVAPLAIKAKNSTITDVTFDGVYKIKRIATGITPSVKSDALYYTGDETVKVEGVCSAVLTEAQETAAIQELALSAAYINIEKRKNSKEKSD